MLIEAVVTLPEREWTTTKIEIWNETSVDKIGGQIRIQNEIRSDIFSYTRNKCIIICTWKKKCWTISKFEYVCAGHIRNKNKKKLLETT